MFNFSIYILLLQFSVSLTWFEIVDTFNSCFCLFISAVHFASLSSMMLIWAAEARCKWRAHLHNRMPWVEVWTSDILVLGQAFYHWAILPPALNMLLAMFAFTAYCAEGDLNLTQPNYAFSAARQENRQKRLS